MFQKSWKMCVQSVSEIGELTGWVKQLENVGDQRIMAIVQESQENAALQQRITAPTERARQMTTAESQQIALRDGEANAALVEARKQASGMVATMRKDFNEARIELIRQNLTLKHYESRVKSRISLRVKQCIGRTKDLR